MTHQTTLRLDKEIYKQLKIEAVMHDVSTNEWICKIIEKHIKEEKEKNNQ